MAILTSCLGNLSGKIGNLVFRVRNGKTYVSKAPGKQKKMLSPERMQHAIKFGVTGKITGLINSISDLREIWQKHYKTKKSVTAKIFKSIYSQMDEKDFAKSGSLMPDHGFKIMGKVTTGLNHILVETEALGDKSGVPEEKEKHIQAVGILVLRDPNNETVPETRMEAIVSWPPEELNHTELQTFLFQISREMEMEMRIYRKREYHIHLITRDADGGVASYSEIIEEQEVR